MTWIGNPFVAPSSVRVMLPFILRLTEAVFDPAEFCAVTV